MKKYKLIALDLDGTLFTDDKRLTKRTRNALYAALKSGLMLVPPRAGFIRIFPIL
ncbi:MAG: HAD hydrolase family protein [Lachnospiraceae bacterium]|nr:HAD hydrolase family protein [Lachnospiraceae bacterium]